MILEKFFLSKSQSQHFAIVFVVVVIVNLRRITFAQQVKIWILIFCLALKLLISLYLEAITN